MQNLIFYLHHEAPFSCPQIYHSNAKKFLNSVAFSVRNRHPELIGIRNKILQHKPETTRLVGVQFLRHSWLSRGS